jgi:hypothetical protein
MEINLKIPMLFFILLYILVLICSGSALAEPMVEKSHIVIIPEKETYVIEVLSFLGDNATELKLEMPEGAKLINISGSLNYSSLKIDGNLVLFENPKVINGSHIALEYHLQNKIFRKKITLNTTKLLVFLPTMIDVVERSENLVFRGTATLGRSNYSILEAENLLPGEEIYLKFEEKKLTTPPSGTTSSDSNKGSPKFNTIFLIGLVLIIGGAILFIFTKHTKTWDVKDEDKEESKEKKKENDKTREKRGGWEI